MRKFFISVLFTLLCASLFAFTGCDNTGGGVSADEISYAPANVSTTYVIVTEEWWGNYTERAFNVSHIDLSYIGEEADKLPETFKIYLPA